MTDRDDRSVRVAVEILIDHEPVAALVADRLDPKLVELGEADGRYAFAFVVPARFRDGREHQFSARAIDQPFELKCKNNVFSIDAEDPPPRIEVSTAGYGAAEVRLRDGQFSKSVPLEFWRDGVRLETPIAIERRGVLGDLVFSLRFPVEVLDGGEDLRIAAPGMAEAGLETPRFEWKPGLEASVEAPERVQLDLKGSAAGLVLRPIEARLFRTGEAAPALVETVIFSRSTAIIRAPADLTAGPLTVVLVIDGVAPAPLSVRVRRTIGRISVNGDFRDWGPAGPEGWDLSEGVEARRGYYAFSDPIRTSDGPSGDLAQFVIQPGPEPQALLRQEIVASFQPGDLIETAILGRSSATATLRLRISDDSGTVLCETAAVGRAPWDWARAGQAFMIERPVTGLVTEILVQSEAPGELSVDLAGVRVGKGLFSHWGSGLDRPQDGPNLVRNAGLTDWPHGIVLRLAGGRQESARGWFVINQHSAEPIRASPMLGDAAGDVGYLFAVAKTPNYCRIEVALDSAALADMSKGTLSFEAGTTAAARRLLQGSVAAVADFIVVDRILVVNRRMLAGETGPVLSDEILAIPGRKVLLTRALHRFDFPMELRPPAEVPESASAEDGQGEHFLVFEFRRPVAVEIRKLRFTLAGAPPVAEREQLSLEDRNIAVQLATMRGVEAWLSPQVAGEPVLGAADPEAAPMRRWRWSAGELGSVEVVICVYNAIDETLACLRSLTGASEVPHTVRIVDDGSDPEGARRLEAFVADKPWMRLTRNPANLGYTTSADTAIRESEAEWVLLLNSDTVVTPGWLDGLMQAAATPPGAAFVGPVSNAASFQSVPELYDARKQFKTNALPDGWTPARMAALVERHSEKDFPSVPLLNGFCTLMRRSVFLELGGFNRTAFPAGYGEENDLCLRASKAGYRLVVADHVYVHHSKSASFGAGRRATLAKEGARMLRELHPDVDIAAVTDAFRDTPALVRLRAAVRAALSGGPA